MDREELYTYKWKGYPSVKVDNDVSNPLRITGTFQKGNEIAIIIYNNYKEYACIVNLEDKKFNREVKAYKIVVEYLRSKNAYLIKILGYRDRVLKSLYINLKLEVFMRNYKYKVFGRFIYLEIPECLAKVVYDNNEDKLYRLSCEYRTIDIEAITDIDIVNKKVLSISLGSFKKEEVEYYEIHNELGINKLISIGEGDIRCLDTN